MTKISQYSTDVNITGNDKWIGSDAQNFLITKNFTPNNLASFFNENNVIDIGTSIRYRYQTLLPGEAREQGTISFETEIGPQVNFSAITTFLIAKNTLKGNTVTQYLDFLVDGKVLLSKASNINIFGYYKITSIEPWIPNTNFFVVEVDFLAGNGFISEDLDYLVSLVDKVQDIPPPVWGSITGDIEDQTDLIDYISSQITTPSLDEVATVGNEIIDKAIIVRNTAGTNYFEYEPTFGTLTISFNGNYNAWLDGEILLNSSGGGSAAIRYTPSDYSFQLGFLNLIATNLTETTNVTFRDGVSGDVAFTSDIGTWGALNYPTWSTGTPFVKMTAAGTFALDTNTYVTTANLTLQNAYNNSTDATITLDATRENIKVKSIAGITKAMSFFDPLGNEVLTFYPETSGPNIWRIRANNNGFYVDSGSNIGGNNLNINDIYSIGDIFLSDNKKLVSYLNALQNHYFKGTSGVKWESNVKIEYAADYSALYSNRSLVDKEYVDGLITSGVTSVTATSPITSSGGATPDISTSMATNKLIGRSTAGVGVMEEITIGTGLTLSGGTLNATATSVGFEQNFLLMGS